MKTDAPTKINLVTGWPLGHTLSPALHNYIYKKFKINAAILASAQKNIGELIPLMRALPVGLTAVTIPHKQTVMPYLDRIEKQARAIGAVNTIINKKGKLCGYNTDIAGIEYALAKTPLKNKTVLILGAGGVARPMAYYVNKKGGRLLICNRTQKTAQKLAGEFGGRAIKMMNIEPSKIDVIINATPVGLHPRTKETPIDKKYLSWHQTVFDIVYRPYQTKLLKEARSAGAKTISGMEMFIAQGLAQIELWSGSKVSWPMVIPKIKKYLLQ